MVPDILLIGYSQELVSELYVLHIGWNPRGWPFEARTLKRKFKFYLDAVTYAHKFETKWYRLHSNRASGISTSRCLYG